MIAAMALFDGDLREEMFLLMEMAKLKNYTLFVGLHGSSDAGKKEGTVAWPGSNEILMMILTQEQYAHFKQIVTEFKKERTPAPGLLLFSWSLMELA